MRLFIAINFNSEFIESLCETMNGLKKHIESGRFTFRENLHLTLVFLGDVAPSRISEIKSVMENTHTRSFDMKMLEFGRFKRRGGDICWVGVAKSKELISMQKYLSYELSGKGFDIEEREYRPHITLIRKAKMKKTFKTAEFSQHMKKTSQTVERISLMRSDRIDGKLTYTEVYGKNLL